MTIRIAAVLAAAVLLTACDLMGPIGQSPLDGSWRLTGGTHSGDPIPLVDAAPITMTFDGSRVGGTAACNIYGGEVTVDGNAIRIGSLSMTEMGCDAPVMASEAAYLAALADVERFERRDDMLTFTGEGVELTYAFVPPTPDAALIGSTWLLDSLVEGEAVSSVMGEPATLELRDDGTLSGSTGCRTFDGGYTMSDGGVEVTDLVNDDRACPDLVRQDEHVLTVIGDGFAYEIDGERLTLTDGRIGLVYRLADG
jgi:heat shock protein HslJ